nr:hypothetical protein [uncultured Pseudomonas sp.]
MQDQTRVSLGILHLERGSSADNNDGALLPGSLLNPETFDFPVIFETVEGAWVENVVKGDPSLELAYVRAAQRLVERGARVISSICGFSIRHQTAVASAVNVPVVMSSLLLLPSLLAQLPVNGKIAVLTYDSRHCTDDLLGIDDISIRDRIIVGGIEGGKFWHDEMKRPPPPIDVASIETDVLACISKIRSDNTDVSCILLECAAFPLIAAAVRRQNDIPVYDIVSLCKLALIATSQSNSNSTSTSLSK